MKVKGRCRRSTFDHSITKRLKLTSSDRTSLVFVHGLGGQRYDTWSKNGVFWPKDLLSRDVPNVRIITFGYDSGIVRFFGRVSQNQIHDHAKTLIGDLWRCRKKEEEVRYHEISNQMTISD